MYPMHEREVIRRIRRFFKDYGIGGKKAVDIYTDAHPTLTPDTSLQPFQRFTLAFDGFSVHPDLVGRLDDGETLFAVEAKGTDDHLRGIAQADLYRLGFHQVFFAGAGNLAGELIAMARRNNLGVLAVHPDTVDVVTVPTAHLPLLQHAESVRKQFSTVTSLQRTFTFNLPTHYLCFALTLTGYEQMELAALERHTRSLYTELPKGTALFRSALSGAEKLGLVHILGNHVQRTIIGNAAAQLLPSIEELRHIHQQIVRRNGTLAEHSPQAGAVLRWLLYADPVIALIIDTLSEINTSVSMRELVQHCAERDYAVALTIFFNPERIHEITDQRGKLTWTTVEPIHYRGTTFQQCKSILKHAGFITPHKLGGTSVKHYNPAEDIWERLS
jgi:hypothetical protein